MSLANKLSAYIILLTILIFSAIGWVFIHYGEQREEHLMSVYAKLMVDNSLEKLDADFSRIENHLVDVSPMALEMLERPSNLKSFVEEIVCNDPLIMGGCIALRPGLFSSDRDSLMMIYSSRSKPGVWETRQLGDSSYDYTDMDWYNNAVNADRAVWSDPYMDNGGGNEAMVTCSLPLYTSDGVFLGVLTADISLAELSAEAERIRPINEGYSFILDERGIYVAHPDQRLVMTKSVFDHAKESGNKSIAGIGKEMIARHDSVGHYNIDGRDVIVVYQPVRGTDWSICGVCPYESIISQFNPVSAKALALLTLGMVLLVLMIRVVILYSMKPLVRLTRAASEITDGELNVVLPKMKSSDDIGRLNNAFADMQRSLKLQMERLVETTKAKEHVESELHIAKSIQMGLVPHTFSPFPEWDGLELYAMLQSAREVGGDLYDFFIRDSHLFFAIGDVSGKGVPASLFMAVTRTLFRMSANMTNSPRQIVTTINDTIVKDNDECMFVTMFVGMLDLNTGTLRFCNAGHNPAVLADSRGARFMREAENIPVGVMGGFEYTEETVQLREDEMLLLYTDGLTEAENARKELFGDDRLLQLMSTDTHQSPKDAVERLKTAVAEFADGVDQSDDLTMLCLRLDSCIEPVEKIILTNSMSEIEKLPDVTMRLTQRLGFDEAYRNRLNLILEEALVNVIDYAYPEGESGEIELRILHDAAGKIIFRISDSGTPFDPTLGGNADIQADIEERTIGGLGIFLIKNLSDNVSYSRVDGRNVLTIKVSQS